MDGACDVTSDVPTMVPATMVLGTMVPDGGPRDDGRLVVGDWLGAPNSDETPSRYQYELMQRRTDEPKWDVPEWDKFHLNRNLD